MRALILNNVGTFLSVSWEKIFPFNFMRPFPLSVVGEQNLQKWCRRLGRRNKPSFHWKKQSTFKKNPSWHSSQNCFQKSWHSSCVALCQNCLNFELCLHEEIFMIYFHFSKSHKCTREGKKREHLDLILQRLMMESSLHQNVTVCIVQHYICSGILNTNSL